MSTGKREREKERKGAGVQGRKARSMKRLRSTTTLPDMTRFNRTALCGTAVVLLCAGCASVEEKPRASHSVDAIAAPARVTVLDGVMTVEQSTAQCLLDLPRLPAGVRRIRVKQPDASASLLVHVGDASPTDFLSMIEANGTVYIVNPNGVYFGNRAPVDLRGLEELLRQLSEDERQRLTGSKSVHPAVREWLDRMDAAAPSQGCK